MPASAHRCIQILELNSQYGTIGNQIKRAFRALALQNTNISSQLQETIRSNNSLSLSTKIRTQVLKNRVLGPTFAACGVSLAE
jgi:hypothetical protein